MWRCSPHLAQTDPAGKGRERGTGTCAEKGLCDCQFQPNRRRQMAGAEAWRWVQRPCGGGAQPSSTLGYPQLRPILASFRTRLVDVAGTPSLALPGCLTPHHLFSLSQTSFPWGSWDPSVGHHSAGPVAPTIPTPSPDAKRQSHRSPARTSTRMSVLPGRGQRCGKPHNPCVSGGDMLVGTRLRVMAQPGPRSPTG